MPAQHRGHILHPTTLLERRFVLCHHASRCVSQGGRDAPRKSACKCSLVRHSKDVRGATPRHPSQRVLRDTLVWGCVVGAAQLVGATCHFRRMVGPRPLWRALPLHQKPSEVDWVWPSGIFARDTSDFALLGARRIERHTENHPATVRGGRKLNVQSAVMPCLSTTPSRLWPAAPLTVTVQRVGSKKERKASDVRRAASCRHSH